MTQRIYIIFNEMDHMLKYNICTNVWQEKFTIEKERPLEERACGTLVGG